MTSKNFALLAGILFLIAGIAGVFPSLRSAPPINTPSDLIVDGSYGLLFGLFPVNWLHNFVHMGVGIAGLLSARNSINATHFARGLTYFYALLALMGLFPNLNMTFGLIPLYGHDIWLHAGTAAAAAYFGFGQPSAVAESTTEQRRAA